jgi:hypothetical protein
METYRIVKIDNRGYRTILDSYRALSSDQAIEVRNTLRKRLPRGSSTSLRIEAEGN